MKTQHILFAILLAALAGCLGAFASDYWRDGEPSGGLHQFVHDELELSPEQNSRLEALESRYAVEKSELEASLRAANARLARAMEPEHEYGPEVSAAIDDVHEKMGALQKATVRHVFDMRELLDPDQKLLFDRQVSDALTNAPRD